MTAKSIGTLAVSFLFLSQRPAVAVDKVKVDVCREIIEKVFIPPTYKEVFSCPMDKRCFFAPHCCIPGVCSTDPACRVSNLIVDIAGHYVENHHVVCAPEWRDPKDELQKWLQGQIPNLEDGFLPGARVVVSAEIALMTAQGKPIPDPVKAVLRGLLKQYWSAGTAKFDPRDIDEARIISNANTLASPYLRSNYRAITLGQIVVVNDASLRTLTGLFPSLQTMIADPAANAAQIEAALLLVHELVHVRQYRDIGFSVFIDQYVFEAIQREYANISFEQEAYGFEHKVHDEQLASYAPPRIASSSALSYLEAADLLGECTRSHKAKSIEQIKRAAPACWSGLTRKYKMAELQKRQTRHFLRDASLRTTELGTDVIATLDSSGVSRFSGTKIKGATVTSVPIATTGSSGATSSGPSNPPAAPRSSTAVEPAWCSCSYSSHEQCCGHYPLCGEQNDFRTYTWVSNDGTCDPPNSIWCCPKTSRPGRCVGAGPCQYQPR
jgi:hypothetical protein